MALVECVAAMLCVTCCIARLGADTGRADIEQLLKTYLQSVKTADVALASTIWMQSPGWPSRTCYSGLMPS